MNQLANIAVKNTDPVKTKTLFDKYAPPGSNHLRWTFNSIGNFYFLNSKGIIQFSCACHPGYTPVDSSYNPEPVLKAGDRVMVSDESIEDCDGEDHYKRYFIGYSKDGDYVVESENRSVFIWRYCIPYVAEQSQNDKITQLIKEAESKIAEVKELLNK